MRLPKEWKDLLMNNFVFTILELIFFIMAISGMFHGPGSYGGVDKAILAQFFFIGVFFLYMTIFRSKKISTLKKYERVSYCYGSYFLLLLFWLFFTIGFRSSDLLLIYGGILFLPLINMTISIFIKKRRGEK